MIHVSADATNRTHHCVAQRRRSILLQVKKKVDNVLAQITIFGRYKLPAAYEDFPFTSSFNILLSFPFSPIVTFPADRL